MLNTTSVDLGQARYDTIADTQKYLRQHGASLCDLLDALDDPRGFEAFCDLHAAFSIPFPEADAVEAALRDIHRVLVEQAPSALDRIGRERNFYADAATSWHGARVSEFLARFRNAD